MNRSNIERVTLPGAPSVSSGDLVPDVSTDVTTDNSVGIVMSHDVTRLQGLDDVLVFGDEDSPGLV